MIPLAQATAGTTPDQEAFEVIDHTADRVLVIGQSAFALAENPLVPLNFDQELTVIAHLGGKDLDVCDLHWELPIVVNPAVGNDGFDRHSQRWDADSGPERSANGLRTIRE